MFVTRTAHVRTIVRCSCVSDVFEKVQRRVYLRDRTYEDNVLLRTYPTFLQYLGTGLNS